jgi:hypothetical protein
MCVHVRVCVCVCVCVCVSVCVCVCAHTGSRADAAPSCVSDFRTAGSSPPSTALKSEGDFESFLG